MEVEEIKKRITEGGYYISPNYGLILQKETEADFEKMNGYILADIRLSEKMVVLSGGNKKEVGEISKLREMLTEKEIPFRKTKGKIKKI
jgi:hypothetical protein